VLRHASPPTWSLTGSGEAVLGWPYGPVPTLSPHASLSNSRHCVFLTPAAHRGYSPTKRLQKNARRPNYLNLKCHSAAQAIAVNEFRRTSLYDANGQHDSDAIQHNAADYERTHAIAKHLPAVSLI
jgi:hypothetical protein